MSMHSCVCVHCYPLCIHYLCKFSSTWLSVVGMHGQSTEGKGGMHVHSMYRACAGWSVKGQHPSDHVCMGVVCKLYVPVNIWSWVGKRVMVAGCPGDG